MPLIPGRGHVGDNIKEFRGGPTFAHTASKFGHDRAEKQALAVSLHEQDKSGHEHPRSHHAPHPAAAGPDHKAALAQMHPEHLHRLVEEAHAGKYGPQAQQTARQAMQAPAAPAGPPEGQPAAPARGAMFGGGAAEPDQDDMAPPPNRAAMFAGSRGGM